MTVRGPYDENKIFSYMTTDKIHGLLFFNNFPETYSYALTKGFYAGLPILYSDMGAVKDRIHASALGLSGGQQQRLCIARAMAIEPEILLMDEPASALDPIATQKIEELIHDLKNTYTIIIVTHNMQQAARISQRAAFFHLGELVETGNTEDIFVKPKTQRCLDFITGRYG